MKTTNGKGDRSRGFWLLRAGLACLLASSLLAPGVAVAKKKPPASLYWGAQIGDQMTGEAAPWDMNAVSQFERIAGKGLSLLEFGSPFAECGGSGCVMTKFPTTPLENARRYGAIPIFSWNSSSSLPELNQPEYSLGAITSGRYDGYIREFAQEAKAWGHPFFLRFDWEMNGFWFPWNEGVNGNQPGEFAAAWRHVHDIFTSVGANNVSWVWCPNVDLHSTLTPMGELYPGGQYVDWTCLDGFNWGNRRGSPGWQSFNEVFHRSYKRIITRVAPDKPVMLAEVASSEKGGNKPAWIKNAFALIRHSYRKVRAVNWYDVDDRGTNWPIERRRQDRNAFRAAIKPGAFKPNQYGNITASPIPPPLRGGR